LDLIDKIQDRHWYSFVILPMPGQDIVKFEQFES